MKRKFYTNNILVYKTTDKDIRYGLACNTKRCVTARSLFSSFPDLVDVEVGYRDVTLEFEHKKLEYRVTSDVTLAEQTFDGKKNPRMKGKWILAAGSYYLLPKYAPTPTIKPKHPRVKPWVSGPHRASGSRRAFIKQSAAA